MKKSLIFLILLSYTISAQNDKAIYVEPKSEYWEQIEKNVKEFNAKEPEPNKVLKMDFSGKNLPKSKDEFTYSWHNDPINQGITGTCWSFSTTSFLESELKRIKKKEVKLSEMFTAYFEYVEKALGFVESRGESTFGEGSQANAVARIMKKYGAVPEEIYDGKLPGQKSHDHSKMYNEMRSFLNSVKERNAWNPQEVASTIKAILNRYMGEPPTQFMWNGKSYTPQSFFKDKVDLQLSDYVAVVSFKQYPYYSNVEYKVPDNWWHSKDYLNVPLDDYMMSFKEAIKSGYTAVLFGDVSEPGIDSHAKVAMVPDFDIPSQYINEDSRQFRFYNTTSGDDHGIHCVGYLNKDGQDWYLIKDSGSGAFNTGDKGYYFYHSDYIKLKMLGFFIHKDAIKSLTKKVDS